MEHNPLPVEDFEYNHGLSISDADTDHDGINDGAELHYWNITRNLTLQKALEYCHISDVDGDGITDGKEIYGYSVKIITSWKSDGTPISEMRYIPPSELDLSGHIGIVYRLCARFSVCHKR